MLKIECHRKCIWFKVNKGDLFMAQTDAVAINHRVELSSYTFMLGSGDRDYNL